MTTGLRDAIQRILTWLRAEWDDESESGLTLRRSEPPDAQSDALEYPWRHRWDHLPKRSAGFGFSNEDYQAARARAEEIARLTLGDEVWARVRRVGYVD